MRWHPTTPESTPSTKVSTPRGLRCGVLGTRVPRNTHTCSPSVRVKASSTAASRLPMSDSHAHSAAIDTPTLPLQIRPPCCYRHAHPSATDTPTLPLQTRPPCCYRHAHPSATVMPTLSLQTLPPFRYRHAHPSATDTPTMVDRKIHFFGKLINHVTSLYKTECNFSAKLPRSLTLEDVKFYNGVNRIQFNFAYSYSCNLN